MVRLQTKDLINVYILLLINVNAYKIEKYRILYDLNAARISVRRKQQFGED